jgi:hypothetical protein
MRSARGYRIERGAWALAAALSLAGCDAGAGVAGPGAEPPASPACQARATVSLAVGETRALSADEAACFRLPARGEARYALAAFDARTVESARTGAEGGHGSEPAYTLGDGSPVTPVVVPSAALMPRWSERAAEDVEVRDAASASAGAADPFLRAAPWREGERFTVKRRDRDETATARVVKVFGGKWVFAVVDGDGGSRADDVVGDARQAMEWLQSEGIAVMQRVWGAPPTTSPGSGQMLVLFASYPTDHGAGHAVTRARPDGSGVDSYVWMNLEMNPGRGQGYEYTGYVSYRLKLLAHELTHAWQYQYAWSTQAGDSRRLPYGPVWALEGTADLVSMDLVRRWLGVSLTANWDWAGQLRGPSARLTYALEPAAQRGRLAGGYHDAASFLRDVQVRMVRAGAGADQAMAEVARGAVEGWFGIDGAGVRREGLAGRVRRVLGPGWEPSEAVLLWTLTQAVDDQTDAVELNNPVYRRVSDPDQELGWHAAVDDVTAGRPFAYQIQGAPGSSFFVRLKDGGQGGTVSARSTVAGTRWMIARSR